MTECYACVCVREFPAQALLRLRPTLRGRACVVLEGDPPLQQVCSLNRKALALGLAHGMTKAEVETFPSTAVLARSLQEEAATKAALLETVSQFSPRIEECSEHTVFQCIMDIAGTGRLFGPPDVLANNLHAALLQAHIAARVSVSCNFHTAVAVAKAIAPDRPVQVIAAGEERAALAPLPLAVLPLTQEQAQVFSLWGIRTLGMLANLPQNELVARMGQPGKYLRQMARGERSHLFQPIASDLTLSEHMELESPVDQLDALLFVANVMLEQVVQRAAAHALALATVTIHLKLEGGSPHSRTVRPALPTNDRKLWLKLLHLDLEVHPPHAAVLAITLTAEPGRTSKVQLGLFSPQLPEPARLDVTLARIRSLVGEQNVGRPVLNDTHSPDAFRMEPFRLVSARESASNTSSPLRPAVRRIDNDNAISVVLQSQRPQSFWFRRQRYTIERVYGPWLTSGEWWKPSLWGHEQWDAVARTLDGTMLCCCLLRDVLRNTWKMAAFYD